MGETARPLTLKEMRRSASWVHPEPPRRTPVPAPPPKVLTPAGGEVVARGLTHRPVPNTQRRATRGGRGAGNVPKEWKQQ